MASYVQLGEARTYYEEDGSGEPLVLLHPGLADSRAFEVNLPGLVDRAFFIEYHGAVSPDGPDHFPVIAEKLHRCTPRSRRSPSPTSPATPAPTLVMVGDDDDEIPMEHTLALRRGLLEAQLAVVPGTSHGLLADKPEVCNRLIVEFLTEDTGGGDR